jgi:uncharacterized protein YkwD
MRGHPTRRVLGPLAAAASIVLAVTARDARSAPSLRVRAPELDPTASERFPDPSRPADPVKAAVFARINEDRARFGQPPVAWDEGASRAGDAFCAEQVREKTRGHYLMNGIPPYARMSFAGVFALHSENSVSWVTTAARFTERTVDLALQGEESMMAEKPPADGHRITILDPEATHVGVGYAISGGRFQMAQEFLTRRFARMTLAREAPGTVSVSGTALKGLRVRFVTIAREPPPHTLTREQASGKTTYSYPNAYLAYIPEGTQGMSVVGLRTEDKLRALPGREFAFTYSADRPGLFTFQLYVSANDGDRPRPGGAATVWIE